jgi:hypothetical protein
MLVLRIWEKFGGGVSAAVLKSGLSLNLLIGNRMIE